MNILVNRHRTAVIIWLISCLFLVGAMVFVGGYTRLSGSGLSITQWKPVHGVVPPLNIEQWQEEFAAYRASPQYIKVNKGMSLDEFKTIFWPEYWHRILGRIIGFVFLFPLIVFSLSKSIPRRLSWRLTGIFALGGLQGLFGWLMVASGLIDNPHVSHLRLALHLSTAFIIFALLLWALLDITAKKQNNSLADNKVKNSYIAWFSLLSIQIIFGAFVAGLKAGLIYNTWPDMNGMWLPAEMWAAGAWHENVTLIQFIHRILAVFLAVGFIFWWFFHRSYVSHCHLGKATLGIGAVLSLQFVLGIFTLLHHVPLYLALAHQMVALLLFGAAVILLYRITVKK